MGRKAVFGLCARQHVSLFFSWKTHTRDDLKKEREKIGRFVSFFFGLLGSLATIEYPISHSSKLVSCLIAVELKTQDGGICGV